MYSAAAAGAGAPSIYDTPALPTSPTSPAMARSGSGKSYHTMTAEDKALAAKYLQPAQGRGRGRGQVESAGAASQAAGAPAPAWGPAPSSGAAFSFKSGQW